MRLRGGTAERGANAAFQCAMPSGPEEGGAARCRAEFALTVTVTRHSQSHVTETTLHGGVLAVTLYYVVFTFTLKISYGTPNPQTVTDDCGLDSTEV